MKLYKKLILSLAALGLTSVCFAEDWDIEEQTEPTVTLGGLVEVNGRAYVDQRDADDDPLKVEDWQTVTFPKGKVNLTYSGISSDVNLSLKFDKTSLYDGFYWDILDEFTARAYVGNAQFEAGKMRVVWGKGDKVHVIDNFNANDYTDYIIPDYIDRRISEPMFRAVYSTNNNIKFEAVYTPMMTPDRLASSGVWQPKASKNLTKTVKGLVMQQAASGISDSGTISDFSKIVSALTFDANSLYTDTNILQYGQIGARSTFTVGPVDLGVSYYLGREKTPTANVQSIFDATAAATMLATAQYMDANSTLPAGALAMITPYLNNYSAGLPELEYAPVQVFGFEGATVLFGRINSRWEVAYNLTEDIAGDDPWVHNNSLSWVAGFDVDLPVHNINVNIQNNGKYILNNEKIGDAEFEPLKALYGVSPLLTAFKASYEEYDVDYDPNGIYTNNKLIVNISDTWNHEKIKLDLKGIWGIERGDVIVMPNLAFNIKDDFQLNLSGLFIWCKDSDSEFDGWEHNSFAQVGVKYTF